MAKEFYPKIWELVTEDNDLEVRRLEVPGGFLITTREMRSGRNQTLVQEFIAVSDGNWELKP